MGMRETSLSTLREILERTDEAVRAGESAGASVLPTGFDPLDTYLNGGLRTGDLNLLGGPQGLGKTTFVLQVARNAALAGGRVLYLSYEHDEATVLARLVALEAGLAHGVDAMSLKRVREAFDSVEECADGLVGRMGGLVGGTEALHAVGAYADRMHIHRSSGAMTSCETIRELVLDLCAKPGAKPLVIVDYLQKIAVPEGSPTEDERITIVVEALKDLALEAEVPILAVVAADKAGLSAGGRLRAHHLRGSSALAYEADVVLMLQDKYDVVARHHLIYDVGNAERFRDYAVISIEKNRGGLDHIDLEFRKLFAQARFETLGQPVQEQLLDERVFVE